MNLLQLPSILILIQLIFVPCLNGQNIEKSVFGTSGNVFRPGIQDHEFTIGETFIQASSQDGVSFVQGFHQTEIQEFTGFEARLAPIQFSVYPNPSQDQFNIDFLEAPNSQNYYLRVTDLLGRTLYEEYHSPLSSNSSVSLKEFASGSYLLLLLDEKKNVRSTTMIEKI